MNECWILPNAFSASIEIIMWFLSFLLLICISHRLIWLCWTILMTLKWIQLDHGMWYFLCIVWFNLLVFCWQFLYVCSSKVLACKFFFFGSVWFWCQGDGGFIECLWECPFLFDLLEEFEKVWNEFFFVCLVEFPMRPSDPFVCRELLFIYYFCFNKFYFTSSDRSV